MKENYREIRAFYNKETIRVYQAYSDTIADTALTHNKFISPPFKLDRMTWIKPSFLWMMYRSGWALKDSNQKRILAIDISRSGFEWALKHSCLSHYEKTIYPSEDVWLKTKEDSPVRIQWDPERNLLLEPLNFRTIQIGVSKEAMEYYVNDWIKNITEITNLAHKIHELVSNGELNTANSLIPIEKKYGISDEIAHHIGICIK